MLDVKVILRCNLCYIYKYAKKDVPTRWITIKYVCLRILEQYKNLKEYFLVKLPKEDSFRRNILPTDRYRYIRNSLNDKTTEGYIAFAAFVSQKFELLLIPFQSSEPMIHLLFPAMCKFLTGLLQKLIRKKYFLLMTLKTFLLMLRRKKTTKSFS